MSAFKKYLPLMGLILSTGMAGCIAPFSKNVREQVDRDVSFDQILAQPEAYRDKIIVLGGRILETRPRNEYTELEILQQPLSFDYSPMGLTDETEGRFLLLVKGFLDPAVYSSGRSITAAARVEGSEKRKIGGKPYTYPVLEALEVKLWSPSPYTDYERSDPMDKLFWGPNREPFRRTPRHWGPRHRW